MRGPTCEWWVTLHVAKLIENCRCLSLEGRRASGPTHTPHLTITTPIRSRVCSTTHKTAVFTISGSLHVSSGSKDREHAALKV